MGHTFSNIIVHIIFSTKGRQKTLHKDIRGELFAYLCGIAKNENAHIIKINGVEDHIHILVKIKPSASISDLVRKLKTNSSKWIHEKKIRYFEWQSGFSCFSVSESACENVEEYIKNQEEHHRQTLYDHELQAFLKKHGVEFNPDHYLD